MKKVLTNSEVCHIFAQRTHDEGRAGNIFFKGEIIYSYGYHYQLAKFIENEKNETAILINNIGYSNSTGKHISIVKGATRQYKQFFTTQTDAKLVNMQLNDLFAKLGVARKPEVYLNQIENLLACYYEFIEFYGLNNDIENHEAIQQAYKMLQDMSLEEIRSKAKERQLAQIKKAKENQQLQIDKFYNFKLDWVRLPFDVLRINKESQQIETSQQVQITLKDGLRLFNAIENNVDIIGQKVGYYTVDGITNNVLKVGCHKIKMSEVFRVGNELKKLIQ